MVDMKAGSFSVSCKGTVYVGTYTGSIDNNNDGTTARVTAIMKRVVEMQTWPAGIR